MIIISEYQSRHRSCEDWSLFTAGLLRFWNYDPYIGSLNFKNDYHEVTLVKVGELPFRFKGYKIRSAEP